MKLGTLEGHPAFGHTGAGGGFSNVLITFPRDHLSIAILTNLDDSGLKSAVCSQLSRKLLGLGPPSHTAKPLDAEVANLRFGTYRTEDALIEVYVRDGKVYHRPAGYTGAGVADTYLGNRTFAFGEDGVGRMVVDKGAVTWVMLYQNGLFMDAAQRVESPPQR